jgi:hypothetical protein
VEKSLFLVALSLPVSLSILLGVQTEKAAAVTYELNASFYPSSDYSSDTLVGSFDYSGGTYSDVDLIIENSSNEQIDTFTDVEGSNDEYFNVHTNGGGLPQVFVYFAEALDGDIGQSVEITGQSYLQTSGEFVPITGGTVIAQATSPSVPEPSSIMATVAAVAMGAVLKRKKRLI